MVPAHGKGTGDWWCFAAVEIGRVCLHCTVPSYANMPSAYLQVMAVRKVEHNNGHVAWRVPQVTTGAGLVLHCSASSWPLADMVLSMMSAQMMRRCGLHFAGTLRQVHPVLCTIRMPLHAT